MALRLVTHHDDRSSEAAAATSPLPAHEQTVAYTGRLAFVDHDEFVSLVEQAGSRFVPRAGEDTTILVVGQQDWGLLSDGTLPQALGLPGPRTMVVSEER